MNIVKKLLSLPREKYEAVCKQLTPKAFYELFYKNLENGDVIELQRLVNEFRGLK